MKCLLSCLSTLDCCQPASLSDGSSVYFSGTLDPQEEEQYVETEQVYEAEQDQGHLAEQGKPPHHTLLKSYYFIKACFVFKIK